MTECCRGWAIVKWAATTTRSCIRRNQRRRFRLDGNIAPAPGTPSPRSQASGSLGALMTGVIAIRYQCVVVATGVAAVFYSIKFVVDNREIELRIASHLRLGHLPNSTRRNPRKTPTPALTPSGIASRPRKLRNAGAA
jgi:hypothetical protein